MEANRDTGSYGALREYAGEVQDKQMHLLQLQDEYKVIAAEVEADEKECEELEAEIQRVQRETDVVRARRMALEEKKQKVEQNIQNVLLPEVINLRERVEKRKELRMAVTASHKQCLETLDATYSSFLEQFLAMPHVARNIAAKKRLAEIKKAVEERKAYNAELREKLRQRKEKENLIWNEFVQICIQAAKNWKEASDEAKKKKEPRPLQRTQIFSLTSDKQAGTCFQGRKSTAALLTPCRDLSQKFSTGLEITPSKRYATGFYKFPSMGAASTFSNRNSAALSTLEDINAMWDQIDAEATKRIFSTHRPPAPSPVKLRRQEFDSCESGWSSEDKVDSSGFEVSHVRSAGQSRADESTFAGSSTLMQSETAAGPQQQDIQVELQISIHSEESQQAQNSDTECVGGEMPFHDPGIRSLQPASFQTRAESPISRAKVSDHAVFKKPVAPNSVMSHTSMIGNAWGAAEDESGSSIFSGPFASAKACGRSAEETFTTFDSHSGLRKDGEDDCPQNIFNTSENDSDKNDSLFLFSDSTLGKDEDFNPFGSFSPQKDDFSFDVNPFA